MRHYDVTEWTDFVRGVAGPELAPLMRAHLATGCTACEQRLRFITQVGDTMRHDREHEPPAHLVRWAKALATTRRPEAAAGKGPVRLLARLVFDSFNEPLPAGVRATAQRISRHVLYEAGNYGLDLRIEHERGTPRVTLIGQVVDTSQPTAALSDLRVFVMRGTTEVATARCSRFGEFELVYEPRRGLRLFVDVQGSTHRVEVSLNSLHEGNHS